jgi:hypothetical protein
MGPAARGWGSDPRATILPDVGTSLAFTMTIVRPHTVAAFHESAGEPRTVYSERRTRYDARMNANEAMARKTQADLIVERAAQQLRALLEEAARSLRPFPPFPGAFFTNAIEVDLSGAERADIGCIVVGDDGGLYELEMKIDFGEEFGDVVDPVQARDETLKKLEDLHPRDEIILAYNALTQITELLLERQGTSELS